MKKRNFAVRHLLPILLAALVAMPLGGTLGKYITTPIGDSFNLVIDRALSRVLMKPYYINRYQDDYKNKILIFGRASDYKDAVLGLTQYSIYNEYNQVMLSFYSDDTRAYFLSDAEMEFEYSGVLNNAFSYFASSDGEDLWIEFPSQIYFSNCIFSGSSLANAFIENKTTTKIDMSQMSMDAVTETTNMFRNCTSLNEVDLSSLDFTKLTNYAGMFLGHNSLTIYVASQQDHDFIYANSLAMGLSSEWVVEIKGTKTSAQNTLTLSPGAPN